MTAARYAVTYTLGLLTGAAACVGIAMREAKREGRI